MRIYITSDIEQPAAYVEALRARLADKLGLTQAAAARMLIPVQATLRQMSLTNHNRFGVRSSFWNLMVSGTYAEGTGDAAIVGLPAPVALRYFGGTVAPAQAQMLAIPNRPEAYNKSPKDFPDLQCVPFKRADGTPILALVQRQSQVIRFAKGGRVRHGRIVGFVGKSDFAGRGDEDDVFYWLVPAATIEGNPNVLPNNEAILAAAADGARSWLGRLSSGAWMMSQ